MSETIKRFDSLSAQKRDLALKIVKERAASAARVGAGDGRIPKATLEEKREPSFSQTRLWLLYQIDPDSPTYNLSFVLRLVGALDVDALRKSVDAVVDRQESLRTSFINENGRPAAVFVEKVSIPFRIMDISSSPENDKARLAQKIIEDETRVPFILAQAPLARALSLKTGDGDHIFVFSMSHIISDAWSTGVLAKEISGFYRSFVTDAPNGLSELAIQYSDYAAWQRKRLSGEKLTRLMDYWKRTMQGAPAVTSPPPDWPRPTEQTFNGQTVEFALGEGLSKKLGALAAKHEASLFIVLMAGLAALLSRLCGQDDVVTGYPIANRTFKETEPLAGFFVNTLLMRARLDATTTFAGLIGQVRDRALEAYERQEIPFEKLVEELSPERSLSHSPLFQVMLVLDNTPSPEIKLDGLSISSHLFETGVAHFDLTIGFRQTHEGILGAIEYNTALFSRETANRFIESFIVLLENMSADPAIPLISVPMLDDERTRAFLETCAGPREAPPPEGTVHAMFERAAAAHPDLIAVESVDGTLTYEKLNGDANRLARLIMEKGVKPDDVVGVMMRRSPEMMIAVLAILKAGGAYLPIDAEYPPARIAVMADDSGASVILTDTFSLKRCSQDVFKPESFVIAVDMLGDSLERYSAGNPPETAEPENLAYVLYTSGSTGRPKGVAMPHRALANLLRWQIGQPGFKCKARTLQFTTLTFDVSFQEIFSSWLSDGALILMPEEARRDIPEVLRIIAERGVERAFMPFVALRQLCESALSLGIKPSSLTEVITAGERLRVTPEIAEFFKAMPGCSLANHYGPTESHVVTSYSLPKNVADWPETPPIGRPVSNSRIYVLNPAMKPVPVGVYGEVYIGGAPLAKGYLNNEALTRERFAPDPFCHEPGAMLYKTGDQARYLSNGELEFSGRLDGQVKIRGYRIEPGEIEAALAACPGVGEVAVITCEGPHGNRRLAAFVTSKEGALNPASVTAYLKTRLPEYMIPSSVTALSSFPMTTSGKIDRKALAVLETGHAEPGAGARPLTAPEEIMAGIWTELLGAGAIGADSNFFESGGHSLLATQLASRIKGAFSADIQLRAIFENQTLAQLCRHVNGAMAGRPGGLPPITAVKHSGPVPLSFAQESMWFDEQMEGPSPKNNMAACLALTGRLDIGALEKSVNEIVRRHEALRTVFALVDGEPRQVITSALTFSITPTDLSGMPAGARQAEIERLAAENFLKPFDVAAGPLFRVSLIRISEDEHALLMAMSHLISDGWSIGVFIREFCALYNAAPGALANLPTLPVQYSDFAAWQRGWLDGPVLKDQIEYWKKHLTGAPPLLLLASAKKTSFTGKAPTGGFVTMQVSSALAQTLHATSLASGASLFMTMLTAFGTLLARHSGVDDLVVGTPIANRNVREVEDMIGFFVNMLPLRLDFSGDPVFSEMVTRTRDVALSAYANQDAPFGEIVRLVNPKRELGRHPLFQAVFVMQNAPSGGLELNGIKATPVERATISPKYDLLFSFAQDATGKLGGIIEYNADIYEHRLVELLATHYLDILGQAAHNPATRLYGFTLGAVGETAGVLTANNAGEETDDFRF
jgi:amino acid adenylation domain-containing protein